MKEIIEMPATLYVELSGTQQTLGRWHAAHQCITPCILLSHRILHAKVQGFLGVHSQLLPSSDAEASLLEFKTYFQSH